MIQRKPIQAALPRLQCMLLKLQKYDYTIQYIPGKDMVLADRLSRFPSCTENSPIILHHNIHTINFNSEHLNIIRGATERDPIHSTLYRLTLNGWPENFRSVSHIACHFWSYHDQLTVENGVLIKSDRVCIPPELQDRTLYDLHYGHLGVEKMIHLTRSSVYWQGINSDIIDYVRCNVQLVQNTKPSRQSNQCFPMMYLMVHGKKLLQTISQTLTKTIY